MITAVIPARGGSVSIHRKNLVDIGGFPLIAYSIAACHLTKSINRVIVSTEDAEIADVSRQYGAEVPFVRPSEFSQNDSPDMDFISHFFDNVNSKEVALIRPTTPFRDPLFMDDVIINYFRVKDSITGLRTLEETNDNPYKTFMIQDNICRGFFSDFEGEADYTNLPRQSFPKAFVGNGHIDIVKKETVTKGSVFGDKVYTHVCSRMVDIDCLDDLELARFKALSENKLSEYLRKTK